MRDDEIRDLLNLLGKVFGRPAPQEMFNITASQYGKHAKHVIETCKIKGKLNDLLKEEGIGDVDILPEDLQTPFLVHVHLLVNTGMDDTIRLAIAASFEAFAIMAASGKENK